MVLSLCLMAGLSAGCGDDSSGESGTTVVCPESACEIGETLCEGNVAVTCVDGGQGCGVPQLNACGADQICQGGLCVTGSCPDTACEVGTSSCQDGQTVALCVAGADGCGVSVTNACGAGTQCDEGQCVSGCIDGDNDTFGAGCAAGPDCDDADPNANPNAAEVCDGRDNNCDGTTDEGFDDLGDACTAGEGACAGDGVVVCSVDGASTTCDAAPRVPSPVDLCGNGLDDDCDGEVDEGFDDLGDACTAGLGACAVEGERVCGPNGLQTVCDAEANESGAFETCNGIDDDCDGLTDEGFPGLGEACDAGDGVCAVEGVLVCDADGLGTVCEGDPEEPSSEEICGNGLDDDCDGEVDEGFPTLGELCEVGEGACRNVGLVVCDGSGQGVTCSAEALPEGVELCGNGLDDDCDGEVDEGFEALSDVCSDGQGACGTSGVFICSPDRLSLVCSGQSAQAGAEICDGIDNDCDEQIDETFPQLGEACTDGEGICQRTGMIVCGGDGLSTFCTASAGDPAPEEICGNGLDDDCDGEVDEGFEDVGTACFAGVGICEREGQIVCTRDNLGTECDAEPGLEEFFDFCDGLDNNCNGEVDEDNACGPPCADDLNEPNDSVDEATLLASDDVIEGALCYYDQDVFDLGQLERNQVAVVNVLFDHDDGNLDLEIQRDGEFIDAAFSMTDNERIILPISRAGHYTAILGNANNDASVPYRISAQLGDLFCEDDLHEDDDTRDRAVFVGSSAITSHVMCPGDGGDWFELGALGRNTRVTIAADFAHGLGDIDLILWRDGSEDPVAVADSTTDDELIELFTQADDVYALQVIVAGNPIQGNPYDLIISAEENPCLGDALEPNDSAAAPTNLLLTQTPFGVNAVNMQACTTDDDWYVVGSYEEGDFIRVVADFDRRNGDVNMILYYLNNGTLEAVAFGDSDGDGEVIAYEADRNGAYYVQVFAFDGQPFYDFSVLTALDPADRCIPDVNEMDNYIDWATPTEEGRWYGRRACGKPADTFENDIYAMDLQAGDTVAIEALFNHDLGNIDLEAFAYDGVSVAALGNSFSTDSNESVLFTVDATDTYYFTVYMRDASTIGNPYRVRYTVVE